MSNLCIIPARGGSKRIQKKNIRKFLGKPIIAYSIETALKSGLFSEVIVSTDDDEIAEISKKYGAEVPFTRSNEAANDFAPLKDVVKEVLDFYKSKDQIFNDVCCLLPTAPFVTEAMLKEAQQLKNDKNYDSIRPIVKFSYPIQRALKYKDGKVEMFNPENALTRSQDLEEAYHDAGMFYWCSFDLGFEGINRGAIVVSEKQAQDIDTVEDWELAEMKYKLLYYE
jgi:pseudaminic acid cytidylyltransferase